MPSSLQRPISHLARLLKEQVLQTEVGKGRCPSLFGLIPPCSAPPEPSSLPPRDKHPEATFWPPPCPYSRLSSTSPEPPLSHKMKGPFTYQPRGFLRSPRSRAPQPSPPLPYLCPGHHAQGPLHPPLWPGVVFRLPQRSSPNPQCSPEVGGWLPPPSAWRP